LSESSAEFCVLTMTGAFQLAWLVTGKLEVRLAWYRRDPFAHEK
jgi:hypothetical protein